MKRIITHGLIAVVLVATVALLATLGAKWNRQEHANPTADHMSIPVTVASIVRHEFRDEITGVGTLKAQETVLLSPKVPGNVEAVLVDIGDRVEKDQVVVRLDRTTFELAVKQVRAAYASAEAAIAQAKAQLARAEKEYGRASTLMAERVIAQSSFDAAEAAYKTAREALTAAGEQCNQAGAALETAQEHLKNADIRSPIAGVVVERSVEVGQSVGPGPSVLRIVDQSSLKADVDLPEADFGRVIVELPAVISVDVHPGQEFCGKVTVVNPMVDRQTRTFCTRIELPNPSGKLVDGMFARVRLSVGTRIALAVPRDALQRLPGSGTFYVFVARENKAVKRTVKISAVGDQYAEILDGLAEGEKVITSGAGRLRSGAEVVVSEESANQTRVANREKRR